MSGTFCRLPSKLLWDVTLTRHLGIDAATFVPVSLKRLPKETSDSRLHSSNILVLRSILPSFSSLPTWEAVQSLPRLVRHSTRPPGEPRQAFKLLNIPIAHTSIPAYTRTVPDSIARIHVVTRASDYRRFLLDKSRVPATSCARTALRTPTQAQCCSGRFSRVNSLFSGLVILRRQVPNESAAVWREHGSTSTTSRIREARSGESSGRTGVTNTQAAAARDDGRLFSQGSSEFPSATPYASYPTTSPTTGLHNNITSQGATASDSRRQRGAHNL